MYQQQIQKPQRKKNKPLVVVGEAVRTPLTTLDVHPNPIDLITADSVIWSWRSIQHVIKISNDENGK